MFSLEFCLSVQSDNKSNYLNLVKLVELYYFLHQKGMKKNSSVCPNNLEGAVDEFKNLFGFIH